MNDGDELGDYLRTQIRGARYRPQPGDPEPSGGERELGIRPPRSADHHPTFSAQSSHPRRVTSEVDLEKFFDRGTTTC